MCIHAAKHPMITLANLSNTCLTCRCCLCALQQSLMICCSCCSTFVSLFRAVQVIDRCSCSLSTVPCVLCRCHSCYDVRVCATTPASAGLQGVGDTFPARGRPVANLLMCLCCVCVLSGNFFSCVLHSMRAYLLVVSLAGARLERFSYRQGRSRPLPFRGLPASIPSHPTRHAC
jgi:hypothetical protein